MPTMQLLDRLYAVLSETRQAATEARSQAYKRGAEPEHREHYKNQAWRYGVLVEMLDQAFHDLAAIECEQRQYERSLANPRPEKLGVSPE